MKRYEWDKEGIEKAVKQSYSYKETLRNLSINTRGGNSQTLKRKIEEYGIDTSHFTFHPTSQPKLTKSVYEYLKEGSTIQTSKLKEKLIREGIKENKCEICGADSWMGKPITCQLHHINGDNTDNRLENLQMLCPNCHSQTENYCGQANKAEKPKRYCADCGRELKSNSSTYCLSCASKRKQKIHITKEDFIIILKKCGGVRLQASKELGISEMAVRKWCEKFGLPKKSKDLKEFLSLL